MARFLTGAGGGASVYLLALLASISLTAKSAKVDAFFQHSCSAASVCDQLCVDLPERSGHTCACKQGYQLHANGFSCVEVAIAPIPASTEAPLNDVVDAEEKQLEDAHNADDGEMEETSQQTNDGTNSSEESEKEGNAGDLEKALSELGNSDHVMLGDQPMREEDESDPQQMDNESDTSDEEADDDSEMVGEPGIETGEVDNNMSKRGRNDRYRGRQKGRNRGKGRRKGGRKGGKGRQRGKGRGKARPPYPYQSDGTPSVKVNTVIGEETGEESKSNSKYRSCDQLRCMGGGRCIEDQMRGGVRCQCKLGTDGTFCEKDVMVKFPKFIGTGYLAFPVLRGAYKEFTIKMEFRPDTHNGLLMFTGEYSNAQLDFFSISLVDGHAQFRFDCGSGLAVITTDNMVALGEWNTLIVHRSGWNGWVQVNNGPQVSGRSKGSLTRITFRQDLYLGGYRNTSLIGRRTGMKWGFVGCVRSLIVNNKRLDMRKGTFVGDAIRGIDVAECSSHICDTVKCQNGGTCVADSADTSVCLCPLGTAGDACEVKVDIYVPSFSGTSYLQFIGLRRTVLSYAEVEMVFKPTDKDGMLFYNGYTTDRTGDFISLGLVNGYVEFRFDLGTGPAVIRSRRPVSMNEWHEVRFSRTGRNGNLRVDTSAAVEGMAKGAYNQLTLTLDLFIGGHRNFDEVAKNARLTKAFKGCIQKVIINEKPLKMLDDALTGVNIDNCNHPCSGQPCLNGGRCLPMKDTYKCSCPIGFDNTNCEDRIARYRYRYRFRRELRSAIEVPMFTGQSYLKYTNPYMLQRMKGSTNDLLLKVRVTKPDGVIFWAGEKEMTTMGDYLAVGLSGGFVHLRYNLGSGEVIISYNGSKVNDRRWHRIHVRRDERVGSLEVDGMTLVEGKSPGLLKQLNTGDEIYIGGLPDVVHTSMKKYESGFIGCIAEVTMGTDYRVDLIGEASDGQNVLPCSPA